MPPSLKVAGHQQWIGSPTNWPLLTSTAKMTRRKTVYIWFIRSIQSSLLLELSLLNEGTAPSNPPTLQIYYKDLKRVSLETKNTQDITKTCLYNFDPLKPHFYIVKLGFTGVYINFLISAQKHRLWVLVRTAYPQSMFWAEIWKNIRVLYLKIFSFWRWNFLYIWIGVFS